MWRSSAQRCLCAQTARAYRACPAVLLSSSPTTNKMATTKRYKSRTIGCRAKSAFLLLSSIPLMPVLQRHRNGTLRAAYHPPDYKRTNEPLQMPASTTGDTRNNRWCAHHHHQYVAKKHPRGPRLRPQPSVVHPCTARDQSHEKSSNP